MRRRRRKRLKRADIDTSPTTKAVADRPRGALIDRADEPLGGTKIFSGDERIATLLDAPRLILGATGRRTSGHVCPACRDIKAQAVEPVYVRAAALPRTAPTSGRTVSPVLHGCASSTPALSTEMADITIDIHGNPVIYNIPPLPLA